MQICIPVYAEIYMDSFTFIYKLDLSNIDK